MSGTSFLIGADGAADEVVRIERLGAVCVAQGRIGVGKQREAGNRELHAALGLAHRLIDAQAARRPASRRPARASCRRRR